MCLNRDLIPLLPVENTLFLLPELQSSRSDLKCGYHSIPMSGYSPATWLGTVLSNQDDRPEPVATDSSPHSKRRRLQPPTPEPPTAKAVDGTPITSGEERPTHQLPDTHEDSQTSHSNDHEQTVPIESSSPSPALPGEDNESDLSDDSWIDSADDERYRVKKCEFDMLDPFSSPSSLEALLKQIRQFSNGVGILPSSVRRRFNKLEDERMVWARQGSKSNKYYSKDREELGDIASPEEVRRIIFKMAQYSFIDNVRGLKANMDIGVNSRILSLAFDEPDGYLTLLNSLQM